MTCILKRQVSVCSINANYPINQQINKIDMEAKLKAKELVDKMMEAQSYTQEIYDAKQCALIAVDEIIEENIKRGQPTIDWQQVKSEITNL